MKKEATIEKKAMKTVLFTDLDDTLFSTARKRKPTDNFVLASVLRDGASSGWQSPKQQQFLQLWQDALIIPVTARNHDAFSRVKLNFSSYAIINHGGVILDQDNQVEAKWHAIQQQNSAKTTTWLEQQSAYLESIATELGADVRLKINTDHGLNLYVLLKSNTNDDAMVAQIAKRYQARYADKSMGYIHINANNLAVLPNWLGKEYALKFLKQMLETHLGEFLAVGCGDSLSDLGFMHACDFWITPQDSQIANHL